VNDDAIKLREALFAAEPFLTYMLAEGEAPRNNKLLREALTMVRGALDMDPPKPEPKGKYYEAEDLLDDRIVVVGYKEHDDGSATVELDLGIDAAKLLLHIGFSALIKGMTETK